MATPVNPIELPGFGKPLNARDELKYSIKKTEKFPIALIDEGYEYDRIPTTNNKYLLNQSKGPSVANA